MISAAVSVPRRVSRMSTRPLPPATECELDVHALLASLVRALPYLIVLVGVVAIGTFVLLSRVAPIYKSEATVLIQSGEKDKGPDRDDPHENNEVRQRS